ncbi:response regulator transcription factor [Paraburkholderia sp. BCC1885]|uniref:response regulator transcription factor n=1 Tax=Paraburkholderia sp. BCC1885 TaxID=2562669 RepID=UPI0021B453A8|nr:response regulator transcription factor [Paraburkholderia sp. BCC1885]
MKFAVLTTNGNLFNRICQCFNDLDNLSAFSDDAIEYRRFRDDTALSRAISRDDYDAIFIDASNGIESTRAVLAHRACYDDRRAALIFVGEFADRDSIERAFNAGADDIVLAPLNPGELAARTRLALRRIQSVTPAHADDILRFGGYRLDRRASVVQINERSVRMTVREFAIAWLLFSRAGEYVSRKQMAAAIWGSTEDIVGRTLEQHIYKLRKKLDLNGAAGVHLRTRYAHGYRIELSGDSTDGDADVNAQTQPAGNADAPLASNEVADRTRSVRASTPWAIASSWSGAALPLYSISDALACACLPQRR